MKKPKPRNYVSGVLSVAGATDVKAVGTGTRRGFVGAAILEDRALEDFTRMHQHRHRGRKIGSQKLRDDAAALRTELQKIADDARAKLRTKAKRKELAAAVEQEVQRQVKEGSWKFREVGFDYIRKRIR